ncbi:unnamed protein product, partial [marine sediment metagenome]
MITSSYDRKIFLHILASYVQGIPEKSIVLDIGCGEGDLTKSVIEKLRCETVGIDIDPQGISIASMNARNGLGVAVCNAQNLPFKDR